MKRGEHGSRPTSVPSDPMTLRLIPSIHRATHRIGLSLARLREHDVTQGEAHILAHLAGGPKTVGELHRALAHNRSTLTSILDRLQARGLVTREVSAADRRTFVVKPTPHGRIVARSVIKHLAGVERTALAGIPPADIRTVQRVLDAIEAAAR